MIIGLVRGVGGALEVRVTVLCMLIRGKLILGQQVLHRVLLLVRGRARLDVVVCGSSPTSGRPDQTRGV